jgi:hypothetical protein
LKPTKINILLCLLFTPLAQGVASAAEPAAGGGAPVDQVLIEGTRADLAKLAKDVQIAEERFYQRYNDFNTTRKYAVPCYNEARTGTRFKQKYCKPVYESEADAAEARQFIRAIGNGASASSTSGGASASAGVMASGGMQGGGGGAPMSGGQATSGSGMSAGVSGGGTTSSFIEIEAARPGFQQHVIEVTSKSPELQKLLQEHSVAVKRYDELFRKVNGNTPDPAAKAEGASAPAQ